MFRLDPVAFVLLPLLHFVPVCSEPVNDFGEVLNVVLPNERTSVALDSDVEKFVERFVQVSEIFGILILCVCPQKLNSQVELSNGSA